MTFLHLQRIFRQLFVTVEKLPECMLANVHMIVEGLVQGVGFRWFVARRAETLGLSGFVRNLYDGNVEVEAEGERSLVEELIREVKVGPRSAHVTNMRIEWQEPSHRNTHFEIR